MIYSKSSLNINDSWRI